MPLRGTPDVVRYNFATGGTRHLVRYKAVAGRRFCGSKRAIPFGLIPGQATRTDPVPGETD